ncbi:MAG: penicillin-binding protein 1A [Oleiphilaceae bacterium]|jgi:penicillin-binding protein 1A
MFRFVSFLKFLGWSFLLSCSGTIFIIASFYLYLTPTLPETDQLKNIQFQTPLKIYSQDKKRIAEFGEKRRTPINIDDVPIQLLNAFISAEDNRFFEHFGIDLKGLARAASQLIATGRIQSGGSTITMQVAKNFFLSREKTFIRKFNEIFLALQIEQNLSKHEILELYLNKIYLGNRSYGIHAAAQVYYGKQIQDLTLAQMAMIAGLPKAPSSYNPLANPDRAKIRRNWILNRMLELGMITSDEHLLAYQAPITASYHNEVSELYAPYIAEMARQEIIKQFGTDAYTSGMKVFLTIDSQLQQAANKAVITGLESYDQRHGYRGPLNLITIEQPEQPGDINNILKQINKIKTPQHHKSAVVLELSDMEAKLLINDGSEGILNLAQAKWAKPFITINKTGPKPATLNDLFEVGSVIEVTRLSPSSNNYVLTQTPKAQAALISISPINGAIKALVGGYDFSLSHYNRAIQAKRQPGSNFKAFIYLSALENGATASTLINDAPIVFDDKNLEATWRPENSSGKFYGPTRIRKALYNSRNLVSIRLLQETGVANALATAKRFGFKRSDLPRDLSLALGNASLTPITLANGYGRIANGGYEIDTFLIDHIEGYDGNTIFKSSPKTVCQDCLPISASDVAISAQTGKTTEPETPPIAKRIADERSVYILHSMLKDVITLGTGRRARSLNRTDLAGKTGTTNDQKDAWFSGFNTQLQTTVWVGFDQPASLGKREYGASAALPIWMDYIEVALKGQPTTHMTQPEGIVTARIDKETGKIALPGAPNSMFEIYRKENAPTEKVVENQSNSGETQTISPEDIF